MTSKKEIVVIKPAGLKSYGILAHRTSFQKLRNGRYEFDFMRGDEEYKYRFGGVKRFVMR